MQESGIKPEIEKKSGQNVEKSRKRCMSSMRMPELVKNSGKNIIQSKKGSKKCGLCKEEGHNRQRCPMKGEQEKPSAPSKKKKRDQIEVIGSLEEEDLKRYNSFKAFLQRCGEEHESLKTSVELHMVRSFLLKMNLEKPFSNDEVDLMLERMSDEKKVMRDDVNTIFFI